MAHSVIYDSDSVFYKDRIHPVAAVGHRLVRHGLIFLEELTGWGTERKWLVTSG
jgi:hypothetical protein